METLNLIQKYLLSAYIIPGSTLGSEFLVGFRKSSWTSSDSVTCARSVLTWTPHSVCEASSFDGKFLKDKDHAFESFLYCQCPG